MPILKYLAYVLFWGPMVMYALRSDFLWQMRILACWVFALGVFSSFLIPALQHPDTLSLIAAGGGLVLYAASGSRAVYLAIKAKKEAIQILETEEEFG